jgi:hypothetical protein
MSVLKATRGAQKVMSAAFKFNFDDTMLDTSGVSQDFGAASLAMTFDAINLPAGSIVVGGELVVETAFDTASYAVIVGDSGSSNRYLATADRKALGRTALVPTGFRNVDGLNLRIGIVNADVCTVGVATLRVEYVIADRAEEVNPN